MTVTEVVHGRVRGSRSEGVDRFLGIPFAAPPVGRLRWQPPREPEPWPGIRDTLAPGPIPLQPVSKAESMIGAAASPQSEDCLSLNVWTPACDGGRRPVLVWIYGGGFTIGSGASPLSDGSRLAATGDVVVVTCNYRLGLLGFLPVGAILGQPFGSAGNTGLLDVVAALRWVRRNIEAFGGDPDNVTVFGQSAGGTLAALAVAVPPAQGLVRRCIVQSSGFHIVHDAAEAERVGRLCLDALGIGPRNAVDLFALPPAAFADALGRLTAAYMDGVARDAFTTATMLVQPSVDGAVISGDPHDLLRASSPDVQLLTGTTAQELHLELLRLPGSTPVTEADLRARVERWFGPQSAQRVLDVYRSARPNASVEDLWLTLLTDAWVHAPNRRLARAHPGQVYVYRFDFGASGYGGAPLAYHGLDIPFPWQTLDAPGAEQRMGTVTDSARRLAAVMAHTWAAFARSGVPAHPDLAEWRPWSVDDPSLMVLGEACHRVVDPEDAEHRLWDERDARAVAVPA